jgi:hypothetical protein
MKKLILMTTVIIISSIGLFAQPTPPELPSGSQGGAHGSSGNQAAPIDGGLSILMLLGAVYGVKKVYRFKNKEKIEA